METQLINKLQCRVCKAVLSVENVTQEIKDKVASLNRAAEIADLPFRTSALGELVKAHVLMHARAGQEASPRKIESGETLEDFVQTC